MRQHITQLHVCLHEKSAEPECEDGEGVKTARQQAVGKLQLKSTVLVLKQ